MATRAIVPRGDGEGSLGIETKRWGDIQTDKLNAISMPVNPSISDAGKVLKLNIDATEYEYGVAFPDIQIEDEGKVLAVVTGEAAWQIPPTGIPDITVESENKVLVVRDGDTVWLDPLEDLSIGTGYFELTEEGLVTKSMLQLASEINIGTGHFQFTAEGDIKMKSGGDYSVGSTLPASSETDENKVLQIISGSPTWNTAYTLPVASSTIIGGIKIGKNLSISEDGTINVDANKSGTITLFHTTEIKSTTEETYTSLYTGNFIPCFDWHSTTISILVSHSGTGQIRATITDNINTISNEGINFNSDGIDRLEFNVSTLDDSVLWALNIEGKGTDCKIFRIKIIVDCINEFTPPLVASGTGNTTNSTNYTELATSTFLPTWLAVDGNGGIVLLADIDLGTALSADIKITIGTESNTKAVNTSGLTMLKCPFPSIAEALLTANIHGRITAGSGIIHLNHYQIHIEQ